MAHAGKTWRHHLSGKETAEEQEATIEMLAEYDLAIQGVRCGYALNLIIDILDDMDIPLEFTGEEFTKIQKLIYGAVYDASDDPDEVRCCNAVNHILNTLKTDMDMPLEFTTEAFAYVTSLIHYAIYEADHDEIVDFAEALIAAADEDDCAEC